METGVEATRHDADRREVATLATWNGDRDNGTAAEASTPRDARAYVDSERPVPRR